MLTTRQATASDRAAIRSVHSSAFGEAQGPEIVELVDDLLHDATAGPSLSLVAETQGRLVGHVLFTKAWLDPADEEISLRILAPLAVSRDYQGRGVGSALVREGLQRLAESGVDLVFVLGHPGYYPRFGFAAAGMLGFEAPHPIPPEHADAWMVRALKAGVIGRATGRVRCSKTLSQPRHWRE